MKNRDQLGFDTDNELLKSVYQDAPEKKRDKDDHKWLEMRSHIYARDKGICWVCNEFVELSDYDLGHLVDRCMGGWDDYDNLAVMHTKCNLSKPRHNTLEDAMRWKLTPKQFAYMVPVPNPRPIYPHITESKQENTTAPEKTEPIKAELAPKREKQPINQEQPRESFSFNKFFGIFKHKNQSALILEPQYQPKLVKRDERKENAYAEQCAKIKPCTICWIQGNPNGGAMWRLITPPYTKQDSFIMRRTPPGAQLPESGKHGIINTIQVIGGKLTKDITLDTGISRMIISPHGNKLSVTMLPTESSNIDKRAKTVGMGEGQIPLSLWQSYKSKGMSFQEFKSKYLNGQIQ